MVQPFSRVGFVDMMTMMMANAKQQLEYALHAVSDNHTYTSKAVIVMESLLPLPTTR